MRDINDMHVRLPGTNEGRSINKFGVPYHSYTLLLANGEAVRMDVGYEEDWGNVQQCMPDDCDDGFKAVGWGNDEDGHLKIVGVVDDETGKHMDVCEWAEKRVWSYVDNYSSP